MNWYLQALSKYADFSGRARRKEYWIFFLINIVIGGVLSFIDGFLGTVMQGGQIGILSGIYALLVLIPGIAVAVRRLHDTSRSGLWVLIGLIPLIGAIILIIFFVMEGTPGRNQYGPNPKD